MRRDAVLEGQATIFLQGGCLFEAFLDNGRKIFGKSLQISAGACKIGVSGLAGPSGAVGRVNRATAIYV